MIKVQMREKNCIPSNENGSQKSYRKMNLHYLTPNFRRALLYLRMMSILPLISLNGTGKTVDN